jgi:hypothetical protein
MTPRQQEVVLFLAVMPPVEAELGDPVPHWFAEVGGINCQASLLQQFPSGCRGSAVTRIDTPADGEPEQLSGRGGIESVQQQQPVAGIYEQNPRRAPWNHVQIVHAGHRTGPSAAVITVRPAQTAQGLCHRRPRTRSP